MTANRDFKEWLKWAAIILAVELTIFYICLAFYHICIFKKRLTREIEKFKLQNEKLERISKGEPEPEELSPTQLSELLEADKTQKSDRVEKKGIKTGIKLKKKKKTMRKHISVERNKDKKPAGGPANVLLPDEKTQLDEPDPVGYNSPYAQPSFTDRGSDHDNKPNRANSDPDLVQTASLFEEKTMYSPKAPKSKEKIVSSPPVVFGPHKEEDTASEHLW